MKLRDKLERLAMPGSAARDGSWLASNARAERGDDHAGEQDLPVQAIDEARVERDEDSGLHELYVEPEADEGARLAGPASPRAAVLGGLRARLEAMRASAPRPRASIPSRPFASRRVAHDEVAHDEVAHEGAAHEAVVRRGVADEEVAREGAAHDDLAHGDAARRGAASAWTAALSRSLSGAPRLRVPAPVQKLPAERTETAHGPLYKVVVTHDEDHRHGSAEVALAARVRAAEVALLALEPALAEVDFARALFIDTETTGLAGGTGTLPFLIGMAWFERGRLVVEQLLLPRPGLETPMLARLAERIAEASVVVSYNGKSFDWPLLRTRFILNRVAAPKLPLHLDLLHCARRVYKSRLGSLRLIFLEQALMNFEREDDIPGELIPETYLSFLRGSTPGQALIPIVDHNRSDLVALPALLGEIVRRFAGEHARQDARDQLGFARVAARAAASERAIELAHAAVEADVRGELAATALFLVGELKLRQGDVDGACEAFERALAASVAGWDVARAHLALAKLHEHKTKLHARALDHALHTAACEGEQACQKRIERLQARALRTQAAGARRQRTDARSRKCTPEEAAT